MCAASCLWQHVLPINIYYCCLYRGQLYTPYLCYVWSLKMCQVKFDLLLFPLSMSQLFIYSASVFGCYRKRICSLVGELHMNVQISILTITGKSPLYSLLTLFCKIQLIKCNRIVAAPSQQNAAYRKTLCLFLCQQKKTSVQCFAQSTDMVYTCTIFCIFGKKQNKKNPFKMLLFS